MYAISRLHYKNNNFILNGTKKPSDFLLQFYLHPIVLPLSFMGIIFNTHQERMSDPSGESA
jgi:hypothetical protein